MDLRIRIGCATRDSGVGAASSLCDLGPSQSWPPSRPRPRLSGPASTGGEPRACRGRAGAVLGPTPYTCTHVPRIMPTHDRTTHERGYRTGLPNRGNIIRVPPSPAVERIKLCAVVSSPNSVHTSVLCVLLCRVPLTPLWSQQQQEGPRCICRVHASSACV